jgi:hypothetical protein
MKPLQVLGDVAKKVAAAVGAGSTAPRPASRHALEELERRAEVNERGAAQRGEMFGGGRWISRQPNWLKRGRQD